VIFLASIARRIWPNRSAVASGRITHERLFNLAKRADTGSRRSVLANHVFAMPKRFAQPSARAPSY
jgi:hypothetical protein